VRFHRLEEELIQGFVSHGRHLASRPFRAERQES
jgi:hypothetical protein